MDRPFCEFVRFCAERFRITFFDRRTIYALTSMATKAI